jgi:hypothetical protein
VVEECYYLQRQQCSCGYCLCFYEQCPAVAKQQREVAELEVAFWLWCVFCGRRRSGVLSAANGERVSLLF